MDVLANINKQDLEAKKGSRIFKLNLGKLVEAIWQNYELKLSGGFEIIKAGNVNLHLIGKDRQNKRHIVRIYREDIDRESVNHELTLISFLCSNNFPVPRVSKTKNNDLYIDFGIYYVSLFEFVEGKEPPYTPEILYKTGQNLAILHNLSKSEEFKRNKTLQKKSDLYMKGQRNKDIHRLLSENSEKLSKSCSRAVLKISQTISGKILGLNFSDCKEGLIHDDAVHHNLIFTRDRKICFLDWGDTGISPFILDFALPIVYSRTINAWNFKKIHPRATSYEVKILSRLLKAYLEGYDSKRSLKKLELDRLKDACIFRIFDFQAWRLWHVIFKGEDKEEHLRNDWEIYEYFEDKFAEDVVPLIAKTKTSKFTSCAEERT